MSEIVLTDEQAKVLAGAEGAVTIRDGSGTVYGGFVIEKLTPEQIAALKLRAADPGPRFTSEQVRRQMAALQAERDRLGDKFDKAYMLRFLAELHAADPPAVPAKGSR